MTVAQSTSGSSGIENESTVEKPLTKLEMKVQECLSVFYQEMNRVAQELGLKDSNFNVAHGMHNESNYSSALDIAKLCCHAMKLRSFRDIVI